MNITLPTCMLLLTIACNASANDWLFAASDFTHNPMTGQRVAQYAAVEPVEPLPDPRETTSRYWQTRTRLRGADGSSDTVYEVSSYGNTRGGFDAQRERGHDASLETLRALEPFRHNPYLFFGGLQGFGYGIPGYPAPAIGQPAYGQQGCNGPNCQHGAAVTPYPRTPGTAYPYAPPSQYVPQLMPYGYPYPYPYGYGHGAPRGEHRRGDR